VSSRPEQDGLIFLRSGETRSFSAPTLMTPNPPNFDSIARIYRWAEYLSLGPLLVRTRNHFLPQLAPCRRALVLGDGDGRFLARLLQQNHGLHALAVDTSAKMLHLLRQRCLSTVPGCGSRLNTLLASALLISPETCHLDRSATASSLRAAERPAGPSEFPPPRGTDLIITHFFLDCFPQSEVDALTARITAQVQPGTLWLLSDFAVPSAPLLRPLAALYIRALYFVFRLLTGLRTTQLPNPQAALTRAGFRRIARHTLLCGLLYTELWQRQ